MGYAIGGYRRLGGGFFERPFCVWGIHAAGLNTAIFLGGIGLGAVIGAIIGFFIGILNPSPEPISHLFIAGGIVAMGAKIGAVIGGLISLGAVVAGKCSPCGFCFCVIAFISPWGIPPFPIPVGLRPCAADCTTLVPPGCP
jgi:hypothetical protein